MKKNSSKQITVSAMMIALSTILSFIKVYEMPLGGAVTLMSMFPICMIAILYGTKFAIAPCIVYGIVQIFQSGAFGWGLTPTILAGTIIFDYILAFGSLSLSGIFRTKGTKGIILGIVLACSVRFICHFVSGFVIFKNLEQFAAFGAIFTNRPLLYSLCYNGLYMLPETIFTCIGAFVITRLNVIKRIIEENKI